jgi:hypothetical protein
MLIKASAFALLALGAPMLLAAPALADPPADKPGDSATKTDGDSAAKTDAGGPAPDPNDPFEDPTKNYYFIGLRYRDAIIPTFMEHWFASGGKTVNVPMIGPELTKRKNYFEVDIAVMYASYAMGPTLFKGKSDPVTSYDLVDSALSQIFFMADLLYEIPLEKRGDKTGRVSLLIGGGVGFGVVFGNLYRTQAYPNASNPNGTNLDASQWSACHSANDGPGGGYCTNPNNHYWPSWSSKSPGSPGANAYTEPSWANSGDKPNVFPWIAVPQIAVRWKPIKQLQTKLGLGFSTTGFFFDLSASYGL